MTARPSTTSSTTAGSTTTIQSTTTTVKAAKGLTSKQLSAYLLTVADMPAGWTAQSTSNSSGSFCKIHDVFHVDESGSAESDFADGQLPVLDEDLASYPVVPISEFKNAVTELNQCSGFTISGIKLTLGRMSFPTIGDMSAAYQATGSDKGLSFAFDIIFALKGRNAMSVVYGDLGSPDVNQAIELTRKAAAKLPS